MFKKPGYNKGQGNITFFTIVVPGENIEYTYNMSELLLERKMGNKKKKINDEDIKNMENMITESNPPSIEKLPFEDELDIEGDENDLNLEENILVEF